MVSTESSKSAKVQIIKFAFVKLKLFCSLVTRPTKTLILFRLYYVKIFYCFYYLVSNAHRCLTGTGVTGKLMDVARSGFEITTFSMEDKQFNNRRLPPTSHSPSVHFSNTLTLTLLNKLSSAWIVVCFTLNFYQFT